MFYLERNNEIGMKINNEIDLQNDSNMTYFKIRVFMYYTLWIDG